MKETSPPQSHLGRERRYPSRQRMDSPTSCAISCAIPIADESNHSATGTLHPHRSATCVLYVTLLTLRCPIPHKKKMSLPYNWRYKPSKFPFEQWKMKISCNSAYVQSPDRNFKFHLGPQAVIVYLHICSSF